MTISLISVFLFHEGSKEFHCLASIIDALESNGMTEASINNKKQVQYLKDCRRNNSYDEEQDESEIYIVKLNSSEEIYISKENDNIFILIQGLKDLEQSKIRQLNDDVVKMLNVLTRNDIGSLQRIMFNEKICKQYQKQLDPNMKEIFNRYAVLLKPSKVKIAQSKVDQTKKEMEKNVTQMTKNVQETESLLLKSQQINLHARDFEKKALALEKEAKKNHFWACSKKCVIIFAILGAILLLIGVLLYIFLK
eukprot:403351344